MKLSPLWAVVAMTAALPFASAANAAILLSNVTHTSGTGAGDPTFMLDVTDASGTVLSGEFTASGPTLTSSYGSGQAVSALTATLKPGTAGFSPVGAVTLVANPSGQTQTSPSGSFFYDDLYDGTTGTALATGFTQGGLLFTVGGIEYNLFNNGGGSYTLYEQFTNGGPGTNETVSVSVSAVPEVGTWGLMLLGVGVLGGVIRTRARARVAAI